jgi:predicted MPP superfamily phosphohydrolase
LDNEAIEAGPLALTGVDSTARHSSDVPHALEQMRALPGARVFVAHGPDQFPKLPEDVSLVLAGHTHCGQIALPLFGPILTGSYYGRRYACGIVHERGKTLIVTGRSRHPPRLGTAPICVPIFP